MIDKTKNCKLEKSVWLQRAWLEETGINVGSYVRVKSTLNSPSFAGTRKEQEITGTIRRVMRIESDIIVIDGIGEEEGVPAWYMSYKDLEPVDSPQEASVQEDRTALRDLFAINALNGMLAHSRGGHGYIPRDGRQDWHSAIVEEAYELADAMLERRKK